MKKVLICIVMLLVFIVSYWFFAIRLNDKKVVFVLPSSKNTSSPYFYKKDGDFFLARDLKDGFAQKGFDVEFRFREDYDDLKLGNAKNVIYFKGYYNFEHLPNVSDDGRKRILYVYYIEGLNPAILKDVDVVATASLKLTNIFLEIGAKKTAYIPQFTNPEKFRPTSKEEDKAHQVLFVGSNHTRLGRKSVDYALKAGADLSVYGKFWEKRLKDGSVPHVDEQWETGLKYPILKGSYIDNNELYKYYASSEIVLNDHREDMVSLGFVSNRIYDVIASGGFVLTDYLPEIERIYGDSVATYKNYDEFKQKLDFYLAHPEEREKMIKKARKITLSRFTHVKTAEKFIEIFKNIKK